MIECRGENQGPQELEGVLHNNGGDVLVLFSKHVGCMKSNKVEAMAIVEAQHIYVPSSQAKFIVESETKNVVSWLSCFALLPWRCQSLMRSTNCCLQFLWSSSILGR